MLRPANWTKIQFVDRRPITDTGVREQILQYVNPTQRWRRPIAWQAISSRKSASAPASHRSFNPRSTRRRTLRPRLPEPGSIPTLPLRSPGLPMRPHLKRTAKILQNSWKPGDRNRFVIHEGTSVKKQINSEGDSKRVMSGTTKAASPKTNEPASLACFRSITLPNPKYFPQG